MQKHEKRRYKKVAKLLKNEKYRKDLQQKLKELDLLYKLICSNERYSTTNDATEIDATKALFDKKLRHFICLVLGGKDSENDNDNHLRFDLDDSFCPEVMLYNNQILALFGELGMLRRVQLVYIRTYKGIPMYYCKPEDGQLFERNENGFDAYGTISFLQTILEDIYFSRYYLDNYIKKYESKSKKIK
jgi:hypothetical protein